MTYFLRALKLVGAYPGTLLASIACSLAVAVLWGGNIGALFPVFEVVLTNRSLHEWVTQEIEKSQERIKHFEAELAQAKHPSSPDWRHLKAQLQAEQAARDRLLSVQPWIEHFLPRNPFQTILLFVALLLAATVVRDACLVGSILFAAKLHYLVVRRMQEKLFQHTLTMDPAVFHRHGTAGMMAYMYNDIQAIGNGLNQLLGSAIREPLKMLACLIGAAFISWRLLLASLLLTPLAAFLLRFLGATIRRATHRLLRQNTLLNQLVLETLQGLQVVQSFGMEAHEAERFRQRSWDCYRRAIRVAFYNSLAKPITEILGLAIVSVAILAGTYLVLTQSTHVAGIRLCSRPMDLAQLLVFYGLLVGAADPARRLSDIFGAVHGAVAASERFFPVLDMQPNIQDAAQPRCPRRPHTRIRFRHVSFAYVPSQPVLNDINLEIPFGQTLAVVGPNGSGKSTLINLLLRFYDPTSGCVLLDDVDLKQMSLADLRARIGVVSQQFPLFNDTVLENIRYGLPGAPREQVVIAAQRAHCHQFIENQLERGYQTIIGENGCKLSGGQRQRIALARAILRDPEILILDEATSQVDLESEQLIHKALEDFKRGRTTIIITHRLSTLALADRIVVLDQGRIVDDGTHTELLARCAVYRRLHEMSFRQSA